MARNTKWTKADTARVTQAVALVKIDAEARVMPRKRAEANAWLLERGAHLVRFQLQNNAQLRGNPRESRAAARLAERIETNGWPAHIALPQIWDGSVPVETPAPAPVKPAPPTHAQIVAKAAARNESIAQSRVRHAISEILDSGETHARNADADIDAGGIVSWADAPGVVGWHDWAGAITAKIGAKTGWDSQRETPGGEHEGKMLIIWRKACESLDLPTVLDLRGIPASGGVPERSWLDPLQRAAGASERGCVLLVEKNSWALNRLI